MREVFLVLCVASAIPAVAPAQMAGGKVVDVSDRRPLGGVTVILRNIANDEAVQTVSDSAGWFTLFPKGTGRYVLIFRRGLDFLVYPDTVALSADSVFEKMFVVAFQPPEGTAGRDGPDLPVLPLAAFRLRYPPELLRSRIEGTVVAQFVVDTSGRADMRTFKVLRSAEEAFSQAVRESVSSARFRAAKRDGLKVRQMVNRAFHFCLSSDRSAIASSARPSFSDADCDRPRR
jgi:TonB family protein